VQYSEGGLPRIASVYRSGRDLTAPYTDINVMMMHRRRKGGKAKRKGMVRCHHHCPLIYKE